MREHGHESVMWGDNTILHDIAEAAGLPHQSAKTMRRVLNALDRSPEFVKLYVNIRMTTAGNRLVRCFYLPEHIPEHLQ